MPRYLIGDTPVDHDGKRYAPGDTIELSEAQAAALRLAPAPLPAAGGTREPRKKKENRQ